MKPPSGLKYAALDNRFKRRAHSIFENILTMLAKEPFPKILDVGCASGIIGRLKGSPRNVFGIERNQNLLSLARQHCERVFQLNLDYFSAKHFPEKDFDLIFCGDVIEHVLNPERLLRELKNILKSDGIIVISVPNVAQLPIRLKLLFGRFDRTETGVLDKSHLHFFTYRTAVDLLCCSGLRIERSFASGTVVSFIPLFHNLLSAQFIFVCRKR